MKVRGERVFLWSVRKNRVYPKLQFSGDIDDYKTPLLVNIYVSNLLLKVKLKLKMCVVATMF